MTHTAPMTTELADLLESHCLGELSPSDAQRLDELVRTDESCCRHYILFMQMHAMAERFDGGDAHHEARRLEALAPSEVVDIDPSPASLQSYPIPQIIIDSTPTRHSPVGSFIFSHVAAAVILGIGLLVGLAWRISLPSSEGPAPANNIAQVVGRITALADCAWSKQGSEVRGQGSGLSEIQIPKSPNPQIPVFLGDRFLVASGLMQITYETGAKLILQGPCTYEIDSNRGGYLAVGKLTAKVKKGAGIRGPGSGNANHSPLSPLPSPLFAVRTPTAVVTDLGTEFGVEVEQSGATRSHVFQGSISIVPSPNGRGVGGEGTNSRELTTPGAPPLILLAGESVRVEHGRNNNMIIIREPGYVGHYIRRIPTSDIRPPSSVVHSSLPLYRLTDLGTLGGRISRAWAVNVNGMVIGEAKNSEGMIHAFTYNDGAMHDLGALGEGFSKAYGVNSLGQVVGGSDVKGRCVAFLYRDGVMKNIGTLGGQTACAFAINDSGLVVGGAHDSQGLMHAFCYTPLDGMSNLGALGGSKATSWANGIDAAGTIVGYSKTTEDLMHAFRYTIADGMQDLGTLGGDHSGALGANSQGQIVGLASNADGVEHVFIHTRSTGMKSLCAFGGTQGSMLCINNKGQIVGGKTAMTSGRNATHSFFYSDGKLFTPDSLIDPTRGWSQLNLTAINDSGQIAGFGRAPDGNMRAFILMPLKEKSKTRE